MSTFSFAAYTRALCARGLSPADAATLTRAAHAMPAPFDPKLSLLPFLHARLPSAELRPLLDAVVEAQARGPRARPWSTAWRRLYRAGCPLDRIHVVLWHSFKDPDADPQDFRWLSPRAVLDNVDRYIRLQFPRSCAPGTYGPGLGCETLLQNTRAGVRRLLRLDAPRSLVLDSLDLCRNVLSPRLRAVIDAGARIPARVLRRPTDAQIEAVRAKLSAGPDSLSPEDWDALRFMGHRDDQDELLDVPEPMIEEAAVRWFAALDDALTQGRLVHDVARDRFLLRGERRSARRPRLRPLPARPRPPDEDLRALLRRWKRRKPFNATTLAALEWEDPLEWLHTAGEMAVYLGLDPETGRARFREPAARAG